jgi:hypothetical protein
MQGARTIAALAQPKRLRREGHAAPAKGTIAFSSEVDSDCVKNARQIKNLGLRF